MHKWWEAVSSMDGWIYVSWMSEIAAAVCIIVQNTESSYNVQMAHLEMDESCPFQILLSFLNLQEIDSLLGVCSELEFVA